MDATRLIVVFAGALVLLGGVMQLFTVFKLRGRAPLRGAAVSATAMTVYGLLALSGLVVNGTALGAALVWAVAIAMWSGISVGWRDRPRQVQ